MLFPQAWRCSALFTCVSVVSLLGCGSNETSTTLPDVSIAPVPVVQEKVQKVEPLAAVSRFSDPQSVSGTQKIVKNPFPEVVLTTNKGKIRIRLNAEKAPRTVDNFLTNYVATKHYDGTIFHFVDKEFMALGGKYQADFTAKPARLMILNEANNGLKNKRGTIAMARNANMIHSSTCQFYFNLVDNDSLDYLSEDTSANYGYCVFGEVIEGMDVIDQIANSQVQDIPDFVNIPVEPIIILSAEQVN
ncbi:MAG: peptidylprolyl isomerase [Blastopirellula sp.]|nr:MAG: peptidylprolyl isomerase [Blastopirellula sp.]